MLSSFGVQVIYKLWIIFAKTADASTTRNQKVIQPSEYRLATQQTAQLTTTLRDSYAREDHSDGDKDSFHIASF